MTLIAVSKQQPWERVQALLDAGHRVFGENRVQEAQGRWADRRTEWPDLQLRLIGPLQSNKAVEAVALFDVIETLDRDSLAEALVKAIAKAGRAPELFVQVNTGEEPQKAGVAPHEVDAFLDRVRQTHGLNDLRKIARRNGIERLSMGMSGDYETAVRFGATHVRVGSALFGAREGFAAKAAAGQ